MLCRQYRQQALRWNPFVYRQLSSRIQIELKPLTFHAVAKANASGHPSRRPRISRDYVEEYRRRHYVDAVAELLHEFGRQGLSVTNVVRLARTARNSFYERFHSIDDCIAYGGAIALAEYFAAVDAQGGEGVWLAELQRAVTGFYEAVASEPLLAELLLVHCATCKLEQGRRAVRSAEERFAPLLRRGRIEVEERGGRRFPPATEEYFSRVIVTLAVRRIRERTPELLPDDADGILGLVGGFFLDPLEAGRQLDPPPSEQLIA
jgi:AcrR family transcriptional regulator